MSVQAGIWNFDGYPVTRESLSNLRLPLAEYGPDGEAIYCENTLGLLYRPFHTTTESRRERQPYISSSSKAITWDGRLDNRDELVTCLRESLVDDHTDVAVVAAAFDRWGMDCFRRIIGDWAIVIWDSTAQQLLLARDYIGVRQLFYYRTSNRVLWCSHLAALATCGDRFTISGDYIAGYLALYPAAHLTPFQEIQSVPPGKCVLIRKQRTTIYTYWSFDTRLRTRYKDDSQYEEHYRHLLRESVRRRLRTDAPVLAELSGGFDSSSIVCIADSIIERENAPLPRLDTFSFHDSLEPEEDDLPHFLAVARKRGVDGFQVDLRGSGDSLAFDYPAFVATPGFGDRREAQAALSNIIQHGGYRVLLSGSGGDEFNGQALDPRTSMADLLLDCHFTQLFNHLVAWSLLSKKRPLLHLLLQTIAQYMPYAVRARLTGAGTLGPWIDSTFSQKHKASICPVESASCSLFLRPGVRDALETIAITSRRMTNRRPSVCEKRFPFLDQDLVVFLTSIPLNQLIRPGQRRSLMRRALIDLLPSEVLKRKTKASVSRFYSATVEKHWNHIERAFLAPLCEHLGFLKPATIHSALCALRSGQMSNGTLSLLNVVSLEFWLRDLEARGIISCPRTTTVWLPEVIDQHRKQAASQ